MSKCDPDVAAVAKIKVEVTVANVRRSGNPDFAFTGDFTYAALNGNFVDQCGNIFADRLQSPFEVKLKWRSKRVKVEGVEQKAKLAKKRNRSIWIVEGEGKPTLENEASTQNADVTVPENGAGGELDLKGNNTAGLTHRYALVVELENGELLVDDPRIINRRQ